jgi:hypothetical protein
MLNLVGLIQISNINSCKGRIRTCIGQLFILVIPRQIDNLMCLPISPPYNIIIDYQLLFLWQSEQMENRLPIFIGFPQSSQCEIFPIFSLTR